eukprot:2763525-Rhodomonas_salina.1
MNLTSSTACRAQADQGLHRVSHTAWKRACASDANSQSEVLLNSHNIRPRRWAALSLDSLTGLLRFTLRFRGRWRWEF